MEHLYSSQTSYEDMVSRVVELLEIIHEFSPDNSFESECQRAAHYMELFKGKPDFFEVKAPSEEMQNYQALIDGMYAFHATYPFWPVEHDFTYVIRNHLADWAGTYYNWLLYYTDFIGYVSHKQNRNEATFVVDVEPGLKRLKETCDTFQSVEKSWRRRNPELCQNLSEEEAHQAFEDWLEGRFQIARGFGSSKSE